MVKLRNLLLLPAALVSLAAAVPTATSAVAGEQLVGRSVTLAGRKVSCGKADIYVDRDLPSEGGAGDTVLLLNPDMMNLQPPAVRLFVFSHECGHISGGDSELDADCFAVNRGVRERWLDRKGLTEVCDSFEGAPETDSASLRQAPLRQPGSLFCQGIGRADAHRADTGAGEDAAQAAADRHRLGARVAGTQE